jgi:hypothetical protein
LIAKQSQAAKSREHQRKQDKAAQPDAATVWTAAFQEWALQLSDTKSANRPLRRWLQGQLDERIQEMPKPLQHAMTPPDAATLERWYSSSYHVKNGVRAVIVKLRETLCARFDTQHLLSSAKADDLRLKQSESLLSWITRIEASIPTKYLRSQNKAHATGRGAAAAADDDEDSESDVAEKALRPVLLDSTNKRDAAFVADVVQWKTQNSLTYQKAAESVNPIEFGQS